MSRRRNKADKNTKPSAAPPASVASTPSQQNLLASAAVVDNDDVRARAAEGPKSGAPTWYDVLEVEMGADRAALDKAVVRARAMVDGQGIGGYLMVDPAVADVVRLDIEAAFFVLADTERRAAYDATRKPAAGAGDHKDARSDSAPSAPSPPAAPPSSSVTMSQGFRILAPVADDVKKPGSESVTFDAAKTATDDATTPDPVIHAASDSGSSHPSAASRDNMSLPPIPAPEGEVSGAWIRQTREARGLTLQAVADATKIRKPYLAAIEDEDVSALPARVFLRGFLTQVARVLRVDRQRLSEGYLRVIDARTKR